VTERNPGNIERVVRLLFGLALGGWALTQSHTNGVDWFVTAVALSLILIGVFSRFYLWFLLDVNTHEKADLLSAVKVN
jgi:hypothetical protein